MDVEEEEEDEVEEDDVEEEDRFQDREAHFVRACAVEMHMDMSQEAFCAEIYRENAVRVSRDTHFARACAVEMHMDRSQEALLCGNLQGKCQTPPQLNTGP